MTKNLSLIGCFIAVLVMNSSIAAEFPVCNQEQFINQLQALPLEYQLHIIQQAIQTLQQEHQPVQNLPANEQPNVQQQQLQAILQMIQDALNKESDKPHNPMDEMD